MATTINASVLKDLRDRQIEHILIDVREKGEFVHQHIFRAVPIPRGLLEFRVPQRVRDHDTPVIVYDDDGHRAQLAAQRLELMGYTDVRLLEGGVDAWRAAGGRTDYGTNVPGKDYGEKVAVQRKTPHLTPDQLLERQATGEHILILDSRTREEFERSHVPGAMSVPGGELPGVVASLLEKPENKNATFVVNCAGRTRSILGADLLLNMDLENPIYALENGTAAWVLSGHELEHGPVDIPVEPTHEHPSAETAARRLVEQTGVSAASAADVRDLLSSDRNAYVLDVRLPEQFAESHIPGSISLPVGQLALAADEIVAVNQAPIVTVSNGDRRARIAAAVLHQMDYPNVRYLEGGIEAWTSAGNELASEAVAPEIFGLDAARSRTSSIDAQTLKSMLQSDNAPLIIDVKGPGDYALSHIAGSKWAARGDLERQIESIAPDKRQSIVVTCDTGERSALAAATLGELGYQSVQWLEGGINGWQDSGGEIVEGLDGADVPLKLAKEDVEMLGRRGPLARDRQDMIDYLTWEIDLGKKYETE